MKIETQFRTIVCWDHLAETPAAPTFLMLAPGTLPVKRPRDYRVVRSMGTPDQLVRLLEHYAVDEEATAQLRTSQGGEEAR